MNNDNQNLNVMLAQLAERMVDLQQNELKFRRREDRTRTVRAALWAAALILGPLVYLLGVWQVLAPSSSEVSGEYAALVRIEGMIAPETKTNALRLSPALTEAFKDTDARGVVLLINSPGGTPVQAALLHDRIRQLREEHPDREVVVVAQDMLTSGAYFVAAAAEQIYVNRSTVTGSIGVIMRDWGLHEALKKLDVERRVFVAGEHKNRLDPFLPLAERDRAHVDAMLEHIHRHFIEAVRADRGARLQGADADLFSGDVWTGEQAVALGLVDGLSDLPTVLRERFGVSQFRDYTPAPSILQRVSESFGVWAGSVLDQFGPKRFELILP